jgi:hypothetical protein
MKRTIALLLLVVLSAACGRKSEVPSAADGEKYAGTWRAMSGDHDLMKITQEGAGFIVERGGRKRVAVLERGILKVTSEAGNVAALHVASSDHLLVADVEFERVTDTPAALGTKKGDRDWKRTLADMRSIAVAWESRATDINSYTVNEVSGGPVGTDDLVAALAPTYIKSVPREDAYGEPFLFTVGMSGNKYEIRSTGENREIDETAAGPFDDMAKDTVFSNGSFVSYPREAMPEKPSS